MNTSIPFADSAGECLLTCERMHIILKNRKLYTLLY